MTIFGQPGGRVVTTRGALACGALLATLVAVPALAGTFTGTPGADRIEGTKRPDLIRGRQGADILIGKGGRDTLRGARGDDRLLAGRGEDVLKGGRGDDTLRARRGGADRVDCGPGRDVAYVGNTEDGVYNCEEVVQP